MDSSKLERRKKLCIEILDKLKNICIRLDNLAADIESLSGEYLELILDKNINEIRSQVDQYKSNIAKINEINSSITSEINDWYSFVKSTKEMSRFSYPLRFYAKKRKLKNLIENSNSEIEKLTVSNRLIKERLTTMELELESEAFIKIHPGEKHLEYMSLKKQKKQLISDLEYLLSTIPGICPVELDTERIDTFVEKLNMV